MSEGAAAYPTGQTSRMRELRHKHAHTPTHNAGETFLCVRLEHPAHPQRDSAPASPAPRPVLTSDSGGGAERGKRDRESLGSIDRPNAAASQWSVCLSCLLALFSSVCLVTFVFISFSALELGPASRSPLDPAPSFLRYLAVITSLSPPCLPSSLLLTRPACQLAR